EARRRARARGDTVRHAAVRTGRSHRRRAGRAPGSGTGAYRAIDVLRARAHRRGTLRGGAGESSVSARGGAREPVDEERRALDLPVDAREVHGFAGSVTALTDGAEPDESRFHLVGDERNIPGAAFQRIQLLHLLDSQGTVHLVELAEQGTIAFRW